MTLEEYGRAFKELQQKYNDDLKRMQIAYALEHNDVKVGDFLITDTGSTICVDKIGVYAGNPPSCVYSGVVLTRKGTPRKNGERDSIYQMNMKK